MLTLPKPKLGEVFAVTIASTDPEKSLLFYQQLGFKEVLRYDFPFFWIQISDGALLIMLRKDKDPYLALTYYVKDLDQVVKEVEESGIKFSSPPLVFDFIKRFTIQTPEGFKLSLVTFVDGFAQPNGPTMLGMNQSDYFNPEKYVNKVCGMFGELALPVADLNESIGFWGKLGFASISRFESPYPWAIISDGLSTIGLHQTKNFTEPAITFFAADMKEKIETLRSAGFGPLQNAENKSSFTITSPENVKINLFKLGM